MTHPDPTVATGTTDDPTPHRTPPAADGAPAVEVLVEDVSIDGMCGVY
ncbi:MAG: mycofactocin precursor MftA [Kineosporiaceae bacterium]